MKVGMCKNLDKKDNNKINEMANFSNFSSTIRILAMEVLFDDSEQCCDVGLSAKISINQNLSRLSKNIEIK